MSAVDTTAARAERILVERGRRPRHKLRDTWWRHVAGIVAMLFAFFPIAYVISAAFNADQSLSGSSLIPTHVTLDNFRELFRTEAAATEAGAHSTFAAANYVRWFFNTLVVAGVNARLAPTPGVVPRSRHPVALAQCLHPEPVLLRVDEGENRCLRAEQNRMAFFRSSCSSLSTL